MWKREESHGVGGREGWPQALPDSEEVALGRSDCPDPQKTGPCRCVTPGRLPLRLQGPSVSGTEEQAQGMLRKTSLLQALQGEGNA